MTQQRETEVALKANGHVVIIPGEGEFFEPEEEITQRVSSPIPGYDEGPLEAWMDGLVFVLIVMALSGAMVMVAMGH